MAASGPGIRLRIAAHNGAPEWGGAEIATSRLLAGLQERGHEVVLFCNRKVVARGARGHGLEVRDGYLGGDMAVHHAVRFAYQLRRVRPDILVVGTFRKLWLAGVAGRLARVPVVARIGLSSDVPRNTKYQLAFRHLVDRVITNADDLRDDYLRLLADAPPPEIQTIHKGVAVADVATSRETARSGLGIPLEAKVIGGVGRLVEQKRFDRLIHAFALLGRGERLVMAGDGPLRATLESVARELGVHDRIHFLGHRTDVPAVMSALDLLVISSDRESMANVMLEAMAVGVPVLSTPVSGAREALEARQSIADGKAAAEAAGVVVEPTPAALAARAAWLLTDPALLRRMGEAGRERVATHFGRERMVDEWERALVRTAGLAGSAGA